MKKSSAAILFVFILVIFDQILKIWVKNTMSLGEIKPILGNWFNLHFVENEGIAFGFSLGNSTGKLVLSLLRIAVVCFVIYYLSVLIKRKQANWTAVMILSLIIAGALGNIIDSVFYGVIWNYAPLLYGHVVDMFDFKLFPLWGNIYFFPAIFNIADSCVTVGIIAIIIWNKKFFDTNKVETVEFCPELNS